MFWVPNWSLEGFTKKRMKKEQEKEEKKEEPEEEEEKHLLPRDTQCDCLDRVPYILTYMVIYNTIF